MKTLIRKTLTAVAFAIGFTTAATAETDENGLTPKHWNKFDGNLNSSGATALSFNGDNSDSYVTSVNNGQAYLYKKENNKSYYPYGSGMDRGSGDFTIVTVAKTANLDHGIIWTLGKNNTDSGMALVANGSDKVAFRVLGSWGPSDLCTATVSDATSAYHVYTLTYVNDTKTFSLYVDNNATPAASGAISSVASSLSDKTFQFGGMYGGETGTGANLVKGTGIAIDDYRLYQQVLTTAQIANICKTFEPITGAARIGSTGYETVAAAFEAVQDGQTVTLLQACTETLTAPAKSFTLALGAYAMSGAFATVDNSNITLVYSSNSFTSSVTGGGTIVLPNNTLPTDAFKTSLSVATWTGTLWIKNKTSWNAWDMESYGNANSKIKLTGVTGYAPSSSKTCNSEIILEDEGNTKALTIANGWSETTYTYTIAKLSGSGTWTRSHAAAQNYNISDISGFTGTFALKDGGPLINIGTSTREVTSGNGGIITIDSGYAATIASGKTWAAKNGIYVNGTLNNNGTISGTIYGSGTIVYRAATATTNVDFDPSTTLANFTGTMQVSLGRYKINGKNFPNAVSAKVTDGGQFYLNGTVGLGAGLTASGNGWTGDPSAAGSYQCAVRIENGATVTGSLTLVDEGDYDYVNVGVHSGTGTFNGTLLGSTKMRLKGSGTLNMSGATLSGTNPLEVLSSATLKIPAGQAKGDVTVNSGATLDVIGTGGQEVYEITSGAFTNNGTVKFNGAALSGYEVKGNKIVKQYEARTVYAKAETTEFTDETKVTTAKGGGDEVALRNNDTLVIWNGQTVKFNQTAVLAGYVIETESAEAEVKVQNGSDGYTFNGETVTVTSGKLMLHLEGGTNPKIKDCTITIGANGNLTNYGWPQIDGALTINNETDKTVFDGNNPALDGSGKIVKTGAGKLTMGARPQGQAFTVSAGTLSIAHYNADSAIGAVDGAGTLEIASDAVVAVDSTISTTVTGAGTVVYGGKVPGDEKSSYQANAWTGTVWLKNQTLTYFKFADYGHANSKVKVTGISGYAHNSNCGYDGTVILTDDGTTPALDITDGFSNFEYYIARVEGDGTFKFTGSKNCTHVYRFKDVTNFAGAIDTSACANRSLVIGTTGTPAAGQLLIASGATAHIAANKTWKSSATGDIKVEGTLVVDSEGTVWSSTSEGRLIIGSGTLVHEGNDTASIPDKMKCAGLTANTWTGTVQLRHFGTNTDNFSVPMGQLGHAGSKIAFTGVRCWLAAGGISSEVVMIDDGDTVAWKMCNGGSGSVTTFAKVSGTGTIQDDTAKNVTQYYKITDGTAFTGSITAASKRIVFGSSAPETTGSIAVDSENTATVGAGKTWTASNGIKVNGTIGGAGTLASATTFGDGATIDISDGNLLTAGNTLAFGATTKIRVATAVAGTPVKVVNKASAGQTSVATTVKVYVGDEEQAGSYKFFYNGDGLYVALSADYAQTITTSTDWSAIPWGMTTSSSCDRYELTVTGENIVLTFDQIVNLPGTLAINGSVTIAMTDALYENGCWEKRFATFGNIAATGTITFAPLKDGFYGEYAQTATGFTLRAQNMEVISLNIAGGDNKTGTSPDAYKVTGTEYFGLAPVRGDTWLNLDAKWGARLDPAASFPSVVATKNGTTTLDRGTVNATCNANNTFHWSTATDAFLKGYLDDGSPYAQVTVAGLKYPTYDVIVYAATDNASGGKFTAPTVNGVTYTCGADGVATAGSGTWGTAKQSVAAFGVNAMIVKGQTASTLTITGGANSGGNRGGIAAVQIVATSEWTTPTDFTLEMSDSVAASTANWEPTKTRAFFASDTLEITNTATQATFTADEGIVVGGLKVVSEAGKLWVFKKNAGVATDFGALDFSEAVDGVGFDATAGFTACPLLLDYARTHNEKFTFFGNGTNGATLDYGTANNNYTFSGHYVFSGGMHTFQNASESGSAMDFGANATVDNPTLWVKDGATLNFKSRNPCGYNNATANASGIIRIGSGSTVALKQTDSNVGTWYWSQQFYFDNNATLAIQTTGDNFRLVGGAGNAAQFYMPGAGTATITGTDSNYFTIPNNSSAGVAFDIGADATLTVSARMKTATDLKPFAKRGAGTLRLTGDLSAFGPAITVAEGTLEIVPTESLKNTATIAVSDGAAVTFDYGADTTKTVSLTSTGTVNINSGTVIFRDYRGAVTLGTGAKVGYTVNVNDCGEFAVPQGVDINSVELYKADGTKITTEISGGKLTYAWEITGSVCYWDYEFNEAGRTTTAGPVNAGSEGTAMTFDGNRPETVRGKEFVTNDITGEISIRLPARPWRNVSSWPSTMTFMFYGKMVGKDNAYEISFGSKNNNGIQLFFATKSVTAGTVDLCLSKGGAAPTILCTMSMQNAQDANHLYAVVLKKDGSGNSVVNTYLDGELLQPYTHEGAITLGAGFQIASGHGDPCTGYGRPDDDDPATMDWLRVYNVELTQKAMTEYAKLYPYTSTKGKATRTVASPADTAWVETGKWTQRAFSGAETQQDAPNANTEVELTVNNDTTLAVNLAAATSYESMKISGDGKLTLTKGDIALNVPGKTTVDTDVTVDYDAVTFGNVSVSAGKTLTFDLSNLDLATYYHDASIKLTGTAILEDGAAVTTNNLTAVTGRTAALVVENSQYKLNITVDQTAPFIYTVAQGGSGVWTWHGLEIQETVLDGFSSGAIQKAGPGTGTIARHANFTYEVVAGTLVLGEGDYGTITVDEDAFLDVGTRRDVTAAGAGKVNATLTANEDKWGKTIDVFTRDSGTVEVGTVLDSTEQHQPIASNRLLVNGGSVALKLNPTVFTVTKIENTAQTNFNGSVVVATYSEYDAGDYGTTEFKLKIGDHEASNGVLDTANHTVTFYVPGNVAEASNVYDAVVTVVGKPAAQEQHPIAEEFQASVAYTNTVYCYQGHADGSEATGWFIEDAVDNWHESKWDAVPERANSKILFDEDETTGEYEDFVFAPGAAQAGQATVVDVTLSFDAALDEVAADCSTAQAAIRVVTTGENAYRFAAVTNGVWTTNTTIEAALNTAYAVRMTLDYRSVPATVTYEVKVGNAYQEIASGDSGTTKSALASVTFNGTGKLTVMTGSNVVDSVDASLVEDDEHNKYANVDQALKATGATGLKLLWDASWDPSQMRAGTWTLTADGHKLYTSTEGVKIDFNGTSYTVTGDYFEAMTFWISDATVHTNMYTYLTNALVKSPASATNLMLRSVALGEAFVLDKDLVLMGDTNVLSGAGFTVSQDQTLTIASGYIDAPVEGDGALWLTGGKYKNNSWAEAASNGYHMATLAIPDVISKDNTYTHQVIVGAEAKTGEMVLPVLEDAKTQGSVVFTKTYLVEKGVVTQAEVDDPEKVTAALNADGKNSVPVWENLVLGLSNSDANAKPVVTPVQSTDPTKITLKPTGINVDTASGATVTYCVHMSDQPGGKSANPVQAGSYENEVQMPLPSSGVQYYTIEVVTTPAR